MDPETYQRQRRDFLKRAAAGMATGCLIGSLGAADGSAVTLSNEHLRAVNRRRRITVQHDGYNALGKDWNRWLENSCVCSTRLIQSAVS